MQGKIAVHIVLVAGEPSGDTLGAGLMQALKARRTGIRFTGIGGPQMIAQGLQSLVPMEHLAVMGVVEVLRHIPRLLAIRHQLLEHVKESRPAAFVGIDAPDFNLGIERKVRTFGIPTAHYVSPSVWAWRPWRVHKISRAVDMMLTLFPFEATFYHQHALRVHYVGHPLADLFPLGDHFFSTARHTLGLPQDTDIIALLPGSRHIEVRALGPLFFNVASWLHQQRPHLHFIMPAATPSIYRILSAWQKECAPQFPLTLLLGQSHEAMAASNLILAASGTATLEALLLKRPMVVAYRMAPLTAWLAKRLVTVPYFSLPNLLAGAPLVPEFFQEQATVQNIGPAILHWLDNEAARTQLMATFHILHGQLRQSANEKAAEAILSLIEPENHCTL